MRGHILFRVLLALAGALATGGAAHAAYYPTMYVFGDSLSDAGNDYLATQGLLPAPPYSNGRFTNGAIWAQDLSVGLGLPAVAPSLGGGTDFAYGGAESGKSIAHEPVPYDLPGQLAEFALTVQSPDPGALYTVWIGANDLFDILAKQSLNPAQKLHAVEEVVNNEAGFVTSLARLGAKHLLVVNIPDLGDTPMITSLNSPAATAAASALTASFNGQMAAKLTAVAAKLKIKLTILDVFTLIHGAVADPAAYGLKNVTSPCWTGGYTDDTNGTLCGRTLSTQDTYLFWDSVHPTAKAHAFVARAAKLALAGH